MNADTQRTFTRIETIEGRTTMDMGRSSLVQIDDGLGTEVRAHAGVVWITQHHDTRDVCLNPGDAFTIDRRGPVLVSAFAPATVMLCGPRTGMAAPSRSKVVEGVARWMRLLLADAGHRTVGAAR